MIIRLTTPLAKFIGNKPEVVLPPHPSPFLDWVANFYDLEDLAYIIAVNRASFYTIAFPVEHLMNEADFVKEFSLVLRVQCAMAGTGHIFERLIAPHIGTVTFSKVGSLSLNASVDHLARYIERLLDRERSWNEAVQFANTRPLKTLDGQTPDARFRSLSRKH